MSYVMYIKCVCVRVLERLRGLFFHESQNGRACSVFEYFPVLWDGQLNGARVVLVSVQMGTRKQ